MEKRVMYKKRAELYPLPEFVDVEEQVIISLTSFKERIQKSVETLKTLNNQSRKADKIVMYIAYEDKEYVTEEIESLCEVHYCDDTKSHKKFNGIYEYPDCYVAIADDDLLYDPDWLKVLLQANQLNRRFCVSAHNTFKLDGLKSKFSPTNRKDNNSSIKHIINMYIMSGPGCLIPPKICKMLQPLKEGFKYCEHCDEKCLTILLKHLYIPVVATSMHPDTYHKSAYRTPNCLWAKYNCQHQDDRWNEIREYLNYLKNNVKV